MKNYKILAELNTNNLEELVNKYLQEGYELLGPPFSNSTGLYCQGIAQEFSKTNSSNTSHELSECVDYLKYCLNHDADLYNGYKSNISMATFDAMKNNPHFDFTESDSILVEVCNEGATIFLQQFIK